MITITMYLLIIAIAATTLKLLISPTIWERILGLNLITGKTIMLLLLMGIQRDNLFFLDIALTFSIVGFLGITLLTRFLAGGGRQK